MPSVVLPQSPPVIPSKKMATTTQQSQPASPQDPSPVSSATASATTSSPSLLSHMIDTTALQTSSRILDILHRYRLRKPCTTSPSTSDLSNGNSPPVNSSDQIDSSHDETESTFKFLALIYSHVKNNQPVPMCLPAFPFKSPNAITKVLGKLPDKAEDLALAHLHGMCLAIQDIYPPGAKLTIISDGLVYNDLLGVPDKDVWSYGQSLRSLALSRSYTTLSFSRLRDLVPLPHHSLQKALLLDDDLDEMTYVANATNFRRSLLNEFSRPDWQWSEVKESEDVCLTYRGYIKFLETDLQYVYPVGEGRTKSRFKKGIEAIAKEMLMRGDAFANAVRNRYPSHLRLSIHPSSSTSSSKLSISPLPTTNSIYTTPWHCTVAYTLSGVPLSGLRSDFASNPAYELVYDEEDGGRPSYYREKSELLNWAAGVRCEPMYPSGYMIRPASGSAASGDASAAVNGERGTAAKGRKKGQGLLTMADVDVVKVRALAEINSPVVLRGFCRDADKATFVSKAEEFGTPLPWIFGLVLEVKDLAAETKGLNNVLSSEWMPFHYDGIFKTEIKTDESGKDSIVSQPPRFQFFLGVTASPKDTGFTVFSSSQSVLRHLPPSLPLSKLSSLTWSVETTSFNGASLANLPLIIPHPTNSLPCLRYHEPWPLSKTAFDETIVTIQGPSSPSHDISASPTSDSDINGETDPQANGVSPNTAPTMSEAESTRICEALDAVLHDRRVAYYHAWEKGDLLISDNIAAMHTRSDFTAGADRELWRIHFD